MAFGQVDEKILKSTLWEETDQARLVWLTALVLSRPHDLKASSAQLNIRAGGETGFVVPPGLYGFVEGSAAALVNMARVDMEAGLAGLERFGNPDPLSSSPEHDGRRMIKVRGGFLILNYAKYHATDHGQAIRSQRYRENRKKMIETLRNASVTPPSRRSNAPVTERHAREHGEVRPPIQYETAETFAHLQEYEAFANGEAPVSPEMRAYRAKICPATWDALSAEEQDSVRGMAI